MAGLRGTGSVDDRIASALGHVTSTVAGPQVLTVAFQGPTPAVAAGTLSALLTEFDQERSATQRIRGLAQTHYYQGQVDAAQNTFDSAQQALLGYRSSHPGSTPGQDASLRGLTQAEKAASLRLSAARTNLDQAAIDAASPIASAAAFRVIDHPMIPTAPVGGKKKALMAIFAGLFVGGIITLLGTVGLTALEGRTGEAPAGRREDRAPRATAERQWPRFAFSGSGSSSASGNGRAGGDGEADKGEHGAVRGTIIAVRDDGQGRRTRPVWTVRRLFPDGAPVGPGNRVAVLGTPGRTGLVRDTQDSGDERLFEVEITNRKLGVRGESGQLSVRPSDGQWIGAEVAFAPISSGAYPEPILEPENGFADSMYLNAAGEPENGHADPHHLNGAAGQDQDELGPPHTDAG
jgi:hypothetical protein